MLHPPKKIWPVNNLLYIFSLLANLQYSISACHYWNDRKAFFICNFGLRDVFFIGKLGLSPQIYLIHGPVSLAVLDLIRKSTNNFHSNGLAQCVFVKA